MLKVGDRVRGYDKDSVYTGDVNETYATGMLEINTDCDEPSFIVLHQKQCRKLKPKQKRVIWVPRGVIPVDLTNYTGVLDYLRDEPRPCREQDYIRVEYVEPRKK